jgi:hypothetical protein
MAELILQHDCAIGTNLARSGKRAGDNPVSSVM